MAPIPKGEASATMDHCGVSALAARANCVLNRLAFPKRALSQCTAYATRRLKMSALGPCSLDIQPMIPAMDTSHDLFAAGDAD